MPEDCDEPRRAQHIAGGPCPECAQGKHTNCTGEAWCDVCDDVALCPCRLAHPENHQ